jgi:WD40 repeat protein/serine/threonine protein kinase
MITCTENPPGSHTMPIRRHGPERLGGGRQERREWQIGDLVAGIYDVVDVVRTGGMGVVYQVRHRGWDVDLAVKVPRPDLVTTAAGLANFTAEAESWVGLGLHPHTVNCVYVQTLDGLPRVFAEWVEGGTLADWIRDGRLYEGGPGVALARMLDVAVQVAWGLEHAHAHRLIHQDVKPANVMMTPDGTAKVTDFGLARARAAAGERSLVPSGASTLLPPASMLVGYGGMTPAYCSPEQADMAAGADVGALTRATDVWSWAVTVLEMFTGRPPIGHGQAAGAAFEARMEAGSPAPERIPEVPAELAELLRRCFAPDPADRRLRMGEIAEQLVAIHRSVTGTAYPRALPAPARLLADGLSNQALSLLDLDQPAQAEQLFEQALAADPHHLSALYNLGLHRWRQGTTTDQELIADLTAARDGSATPWLGDLLLAQVHLERGDAVTARALLGRAAEQAGGEAAVAAAVAAAQRQSAVEHARILADHSEWVDDIALSGDGRIVATGDTSCTVRLWDVATGAGLHLWEQRLAAGHLSELTLSADGAVVLWHDNRTRGIRVWEPGSGSPPRAIDLDDRNVVYAAALSADGSVAALCGAQGEVSIWDTASGRRIRTLFPGDMPQRGSMIEYRRVWTGPPGRPAVVHDPLTNRITLWDLSSGYSLGGLDGCREIRAVSMDGRTVLGAAVTGGDRLWDVDTGRSRPVQLPPGVAHGRVIDDAGSAVLARGPARGLQVWQLEPARCRVTFLGENVMSPFAPVVMSADGRLVAAAYRDVVHLLPVPDPGPPAPWSYGRPRDVAEIIAAEETVATAVRRVAESAEVGIPTAADALRDARRVPGHERSPELLRQWRRLAPAGRRTSLQGAWRVRRFAGRGSWRETADGGVVFTATADGRLRLWNLETGELRCEFQGHEGRVPALAVNADATQGYSAGGDGYLRMWDLSTGACTGELRPWLMPVRLTGTGLAVGKEQNTGALSVHDLPAGRCRWAAGGFATTSPHRIFLAAGESLVLTTNSDHSGQVWDLGSGRCLVTLAHRKSHVLELAVDTERGRVFTYEGKGGIRVWDLETGRRGPLLRGTNVPSAHSMVLSPDGRHLLTCGDGMDPFVRVWEADSGRLVHALTGHSGIVKNVVVSRDGTVAVSTSSDGTARVWELHTGQCLRVLDNTGDWELSAADDLHRVLTESGAGSEWPEEMQLWELDWEYDFIGTTAPPLPTEPLPRPAGRWSRLLGRR